MWGAGDQAGFVAMVDACMRQYGMVVILGGDCCDAMSEGGSDLMDAFF